MSQLTLRPVIHSPAPLAGFFAKRPAAALAVLTPLVLLIHGYHPMADDGAIYVAGVKKLINPSLYQPDAVFVISHTHLSIFAHCLAGLVRYAHIPLPALLLACHVASIFLFLLGIWRIAIRVFATRGEQWGALLLAACCFTLPVAGTSLSVMDPYVTARSFSTPVTLFALAASLDGAWIGATLWLALASLLHPLMAGYAAIFLAAHALVARRMWWSTGVFLGLGFLLCAAIFAATRHVPLDLAYSRAALSRSYFFLSTWSWYEYPGLVMPLLLLGAAALRPTARSAAGRLAMAARLVGGCALVCALCFVHRSGSLMLARLQILRCFQFVYIVGVLLAGGLMGKLARRHIRTVALLYLIVLLAIFTGQRLTYSASDHLEWPGARPRNPWQEAYLWIRANTPRDAIFAMDANYIRGPGEDAQGFRAIAERSAVADWLKDGGVASIFPAAAIPWWREVQATRNLDQATDVERLSRLKPFGVTWILLPEGARTAFSCPYANPGVRVCRLGPSMSP